MDYQLARAAFSRHMNKTLHAYNSLAACVLLMLLVPAAQAQEDAESAEALADEAQVATPEAPESMEAATQQAGLSDVDPNEATESSGESSDPEGEDARLPQAMQDDVPVADAESAQLTEPGPDGGAGYDDELTGYFHRFEELLNDGLYDEAELVAKQMVELSIRERGRDHKDIAGALVNLGIAQYRLEQYELAELNFEAAIGTIERSDDRLSPYLVNPLKGLGATQMQTGKPDKALQSYDRAVHITHVNEGPQNLEQIEILDSLAETYLALGDTAMANDMQERAFELQLRRTGKDSIDLIPALNRMGEWQARLYLVADMKATYLRIIRILENEYGKDSMDLVEPLMKLGHSYLYDDPTVLPATRGLMAGYGEIYLKRALNIAIKSEEATWRDKVEILLELGDFYTISDNPGRARKRYLAAWALLSEGDDIDEKLALRGEEMEVPIRQRTVIFPEIAGDVEPSKGRIETLYKRGYYDISFTITRRGLVDDVVIVRADPEGLEDLEKRVLRSAKLMIYRPKFENGQAVDAVEQIYHHEFFYRDMDLRKADPADNAPTESSESR
jgi:tetratricopeptide (TPR) repeat protein